MSDLQSSPAKRLEAAIPVASQWLTECASKHASCVKKARHSTVFCTDNSLLISDLAGDGLVATRLLSFPLKPSTDEEDIVRLQLSESLGADTQYVALSHRWGSHETCCTKKDNLEEMVKNGMPTSKLPATFRDAVHVARGLGFSHVWIDSLCIVQDDKEDWKFEARRMAIIYDNAACTIAAMDGLDSDAGLFVQDAKLKTVGVLDSRAWVCQERMISPRSLIFTAGSVTWECRECDASLEIPELKPRRLGDVDETPTHPKDIFAFFRDWRLPPPEPESEAGSDDEDGSEDGEESEGQDEDTDGEESHGDEPDGEEEMEDDKSEAEEAKEAEEEEVEGEYEMTTAPDNEEMVVFKPGKVQKPTADDDYDSDGYPSYKGGLPGHAANLSIFLEGERESKSYDIHPNGPNEDGSDPFGAFMVVVTDLARSREAYHPFIKTWWQFLSIYSPLSLTYGSDKFLAINGITTVAQRWSHLRSSFGLFWHFLEYEMLWYVDPKGPPGARQETWLVPTWSWASTRNGRVVNDMYRRLPMRGSIMIKPEIRPGMGTAFDQPLPFVAWMARRYHVIEMKGDLRKGVVTATRGEDGQLKYPIVLDGLGRFSDEEVHDFRPDCAEEFPVGEPVNVLYMVWYHYDADYWKLQEHIDVGLVFRQMKGETEIAMYDEDVEKTSLSAERLLTRVGYLENTYPVTSMRNFQDVLEELTWYFVRIA